MPIRLAICDDHPLVISGLLNTLRDAPHINITATYREGVSLLQGLRAVQPDVLLLDIQLPGQSGTELAGIISKNYPEIKIIALTSIDTIPQVKAMMLNKCMGYLLKSNTDHQQLTTAIEEVYAGNIFIEPSLKDELTNRMLGIRTPKKTTQPRLTRREKEILQLIVDEKTNQEIADMLYISLHTVENHRFSLLKKLEVKNTAGLVKLALRAGLAE